MTEIYFELSNSEINDLIKQKMKIYPSDLSRVNMHGVVPRGDFIFQYYAKFHGLDIEKYELKTYVSMHRGTDLYHFYNVTKVEDAEDEDTNTEDAEDEDTNTEDIDFLTIARAENEHTIRILKALLKKYKGTCNARIFMFDGDVATMIKAVLKKYDGTASNETVKMTTAGLSKLKKDTLQEILQQQNKLTNGTKNKLVKRILC